MSAPRTGSAVDALVDAISSDLGEIRLALESAREGLSTFEAHTRGLNGLSSFARAQGLALDTMIANLGEAADGISDKLHGTNGQPTIVSTVDEAQVGRVRDALAEPRDQA